MRTPTIEDISVSLDEMPMHEMVSEYDVKEWLDSHYDAVVFALAFCKKALGQKSELMQSVGGDVICSILDDNSNLYSKAHKKWAIWVYDQMILQIIMEIKNEQ